MVDAKKTSFNVTRSVYMDSMSDMVTRLNQAIELATAAQKLFYSWIVLKVLDSHEFMDNVVAVETEHCDVS